MINPLPPAPSPTDSVAVFDTKAFAFLAALNPWSGEVNAEASDMNAVSAAVQTNADITAALTLGTVMAGFAGTSTTSLTLGTGAKAITTQSGKSWTVGRVVIVHNGLGAYMKGTVTGYTGTALDVNVTSVVGSGTFASWYITVGYAALAASGPNTDITSINGVSINKGTGTTTGNIVLGSVNTLGVNTTGTANMGIGDYALYYNTTGYSNIAVGFSAMLFNVGGSSNVAIGYEALHKNAVSGNTGVGNFALHDNATGSSNVACGQDALTLQSSGDCNVALGFQANTNFNNYSNCGGIGYQSLPGGSNQLRLGNTSVTVYTQSGTVSASDVRDKADIRDTTLGLSFINSLRPVDYKWDIRLDYAPPMPNRDSYVGDDAAYVTAMTAYAEASRPANLTHDGSKKRNRYHHGLIAQEVGALVAATGVDFGGYQDFEVNGGEALQAVAYEELIAPLIKAVQELSTTVTAQEARIAALEARLP